MRPDLPRARGSSLRPYQGLSADEARALGLGVGQSVTLLMLLDFLLVVEVISIIGDCVDNNWNNQGKVAMETHL